MRDRQQQNSGFRDVTRIVYVVSAILFGLAATIVVLQRQSVTPRNTSTTAATSGTGVTVAEVIGRSGFCLFQEMVANGEFVSGEMAFSAAVASIGLADHTSDEDASKWLRKAEMDYESGEFTRDDCPKYQAMEEEIRIGSVRPF